MIIKQKEWKTMKLKYISTINEETLSEDTSPYLNINYIDIGNVDSNGIIDTIATYTFSEAPSRARRIVRKGDILISTVRTYLEAITSIETDEENLIASTGFAIIRPSKTKLNQAFCRYAVKQSNFLSEVQTRSVGVSYPAINASELGNISLKVPCLKDQIEISTFLNNEILIIDALITSKTNFITLLTEKRQSLITQAATKGLNPKVKMKSTGVEWLGEVPEHWEVLQLKYITTEPLKYGANEAALDDNINNPRFVRITDIDENGNLRSETFKSLEPELAAPFLLSHGDVLLARSGATVGKAFMYKSSWGLACFAGYLISVRSDVKKILPEFLILITQSQYYWTQIYAGTIQATIQNFNGEKYGSMKIILPKISEQFAIVDFLKKELFKLDSIKEKTLDSINLLSERRSALISAVVTGQIKIPTLQ